MERLIILLPLLAALGCPPGTAAPSPSVNLISVSVAHPSRRDVTRHLTLPGTVWAWQQADLSARVTGYVRDMRVDKGDSVKKGQVLATLDVPDLVHGLGVADAEALTAKSRISETERAADLAKATLARLEAARREDARAITEEALDEARTRAQGAEAALQAARSAFDRAVAARAGGATMVRFGLVEAPFDGVITARNADTGALVKAAGDPLFAIADMSRMRIYVQVPDTEVGHVAAGHKASLTVDAHPKRMFEGVVTRLSRALDPSTRTMKVEIDLDNGDQALFPGMFGRVQLELDTHANALVVPMAVVTRQKDKAFVFKPEGAKAKRVPVTLGTESADVVEVLDGVQDSDSLLVSKAALADGMPIAIAGSR